jgi:hypothetical protein
MLHNAVVASLTFDIVLPIYALEAKCIAMPIIWNPENGCPQATSTN